jgi:MotA/TolQ/ExbB proton channel family
MMRATGILATIGATAPFVGLFGTVWGIMNSFIGISKLHTTNLAVVAPGIAEALLARAFGLGAAIPAVGIYNIFARSIANYRALYAQRRGPHLGESRPQSAARRAARYLRCPAAPAGARPADAKTARQYLGRRIVLCRSGQLQMTRDGAPPSRTVRCVERRKPTVGLAAGTPGWVSWSLPSGLKAGIVWL